MDESESQVGAPDVVPVAAKKGNNPSGVGGFRKGRSGRFVPIGEHKAVLERLAEFEGIGPSPVSKELVAKDAEIAGLREQLEEREAKNRVKVLEAERVVLLERVAELEGHVDDLSTPKLQVDEGSLRCRELYEKCLSD